MTWHTAIGPKPTPTDLAEDLFGSKRARPESLRWRIAMNDEHFHSKLWKEKLSSLQAKQERDDSDLALASELWAAYDGGPGNNLKSIPLAIAVFRGAALK